MKNDASMPMKKVENITLLLKFLFRFMMGDIVASSLVDVMEFEATLSSIMMDSCNYFNKSQA